LAGEQAARVAAEQVKESLRQSEERFRTAFDHAAIGMDLVDLEGRFLQVNAALCALTGYTEPELLTKSFQDITHSDDLAADLALVDQLLAGEIRAFQMEKRYLRKDRTVVWGRVNTSLLRDGQGDPLYFISQIEDITARKRTQDELRRSEARFRSLIVNATDLITILTADGTILYESPPIERILGYGGNELVGRNAFDLVHPEDRAATWAAFDRALADPEQEPMVEFRCQHKDGSWRWLESTGTNLLADENVSGFVVNSRDITDRKRVDQELRTVLEEAQAANRAKGLFLNMMSHELRTPLQAVLGYSESLLIGSRDVLSPEQREDIGYIHQAGQRMISLINQVLDLSRLEAGRLELATDPVDLAQVIEQVRQDVAPQAAGKCLDVQIALPPVFPLVIGDAERLRQILLNLAGNAVKFTSAGHIRITAVATASGGVGVEVSDTGMGIPKNALPHIFEEFRQVDSSLSRRHGGAGLGLAIARSLAEQMGGSISVSSEPGVGSTFRLHLPGGQP
jgi:two-component system sensor histidine kinase/response regulator